MAETVCCSAQRICEGVAWVTLMRLQGDVPKYLDQVIEIGGYAVAVIHKAVTWWRATITANARGSFLY